MYNSIRKAVIVGKKVIYLPSCHSTNDIAAELLQKGLGEDGTIVITDEQTKGRGQRGTEWSSGVSQNLTFSVIIRPEFIPIASQFLISQTFALGVNAYVRSHGLEGKIKWPNDIMVGDRKICGMLVENVIQGTGISSSIVGIGLNINGIQGGVRATSMSDQLGFKLALTEEFTALAMFLDHYYLRLRALEFDGLQQEYLSQLLGLNQKRQFRFSFGTTNATIVGTNKYGRLLVSVEGETHVRDFDIKELEWIWEN